MTAKRTTTERRSAERGHPSAGSTRRSRPSDAPRAGQQRANGSARRSAGSAPHTSPTTLPSRAKNTSQAKARAKARKAKAPKVVRPPLRDRLVARLSEIKLDPRTLAAKVPFVVLVIGSLAIGLGLTLWLSTDSAERSYQLGNAKETDKALTQQKEELERDVLQAQAAPSLAEAARNLGMIPSRDTAHLVQDPNGNWVVVGTPKPADGVPPPPLNTPLPAEKPAPPPVVNPVEVPVRVTPTPVAGPPVQLQNPAAGPGAEVLVRTPLPAVPGAQPAAPAAASPDQPVVSAPAQNALPAQVPAPPPQADGPQPANPQPANPQPANPPQPGDDHGVGAQTPGPAA
jgi:hypothetical protein